MKKIILTIAIISLSLTAGFAQKLSDNATLNIKLNAIQTIEVNATQKAVDLIYKSVEDYSKGVSLEQTDHLKVYSTGAFFVTVNSAVNDITRTNGEETIAASTIKIKASEGSTNKLSGATVGEASLSTTATNIISSGVGGVNKNFNITYSGMGADAYVNKYFNDETPTTYSTVVTYTIAAQ